MKKVEGRKGEYNEFVEFVLGAKHSIIAQKGSAGWWYVFENKHGSIATLDQYQQKGNAVNKARQIAESK